MEYKCAICGKPVNSNEAIVCSECSAPMHKECFDEEILSDATGTPLCPTCALRSAVDWVDHILSLYAKSIKEPARSELRERLRNLATTLE